MLGRFQLALHRGVLAGLQQHQQQCQQLEVLGLQAARSYFNDYKVSKMLPRKLKELQRRTEAVQKAISKKQQAEAAAAASSSTSPAADAASTAAAAAATAHNSGPVASPLSQVPRAPGSTSLVPQGTAASAPEKEEPKSWVPAWLDKVMDYPRRRRAPPLAPGTASPLQSNAPDAASKEGGKEDDKEADGWAGLEKNRNLSLDGYQNLVRTETGSEASEMPPRPQKPPKRGPSSTLRGRMDRERVKHARYEQQISIISMMDLDDKLRIKADPLGFLKDHEAVARIARTTQTTEGAVRDLVYCFKQQQETFDLLLEHRDAGRKMPLSTDALAINQLLDKLRQRKRLREYKVALQHRDPENCQLKAWAKVVGRNRMCPRTELPYKYCCGATSSGKKALHR